MSQSVSVTFKPSSTILYFRSIDDARASLGISKATAQRWLSTPSVQPPYLKFERLSRPVKILFETVSDGIRK